MRVLRYSAKIVCFLWSLAGECTIFLGCLAVMCDSQDLTLQAILSNGVAIVKQRRLRRKTFPYCRNRAGSEAPSSVLALPAAAAQTIAPQTVAPETLWGDRGLPA
jgi:hypothetical protein